MSREDMSPLVSAEDVEARLGDPVLLVLDIRSKADGGKEAFAQGHIPGAVHSDYEADGWRRAEGGVPGLLPTAEHLANLFGRLGLRPQDQVVVVSAGAGAMDLAGAARVYWTLKSAGHPRVAVLDGGYRAWTENSSRPIEIGAGSPRQATIYPVSFHDSLRSDLGRTQEALRAHSAAFVDARSAAFFEGREKAPSSKAAGHIPGALSRDYSQTVDARTGRLLPLDRLKDMFGSVGEGAVINYCNTGHTAALNWFVLSEVLGRPETRLFDGSMAEWTQDPARPVETGRAD